MRQTVNNKKFIIECPHCGAEYLLDEVLYADKVIGRSEVSETVKDPLGKLLYKSYVEEPAESESFTCEYCGKPFEVEIELNTISRAERKEKDFSKTSTSLW